MCFFNNDKIVIIPVHYIIFWYLWASFWHETLLVGILTNKAWKHGRVKYKSPQIATKWIMMSGSARVWTKCVAHTPKHVYRRTILVEDTSKCPRPFIRFSISCMFRCQQMNKFWLRKRCIAIFSFFRSPNFRVSKRLRGHDLGFVLRSNRAMAARDIYFRRNWQTNK